MLHNPIHIVNKSCYSLNQVLGPLFLFLIAFPYLQIIPVPSYTQPFPLIIGTVLFLLNANAIWKMKFQDRAALICLAAVGVVLFLLTCIPYTNVQEYKYLLSYISPLIITVAIFLVLQRSPDMCLRLLQISIAIWFCISVIQTLFDPTFATFTLGEWGEHSTDIVSSGRGVLGLAPEPTHHAFHIQVLGASLVLLDTNNRSRWFLVACLIEAVILAASSSAILVLGFAGMLWLLLHRTRWFVIALIVSSVAWSMNFTPDLLLKSGSRAQILISEVMANPASIMNIDYSMNIRLGGLFATLIDVTEYGFLPRGMSVDAWLNAREQILSLLPWLMDLSMTGPPSGLGLLLFQGGILVLPCVVLIFYRILSIKLGAFEQIFLISTLFIFLFQYYISSPSFSLLYACAIYRISIVSADTKFTENTTQISTDIGENFISPPQST